MHQQKVPPPGLVRRGVQQGSMLLEAMIAILIFSMGVLAIVGLQAAMVRNTAEAKYRADASYIAQQRIGLMWSDPANAANYLEGAPAPAPAADISALLPRGTRTTTQAGTQFTVTVTWQAPGEAAPHNFTTTASINGG